MVNLDRILGSRVMRRLTTDGRSSAGFTLIEMMVVMALIVILAGVGVMSYTNSVKRAQEATLKEDLFQMRGAIDQYYADKNKYPESLEALVADKYIRGLPVDPFTNSSTTWTTTPAEPQPGSTSTTTGIFDVKSGSDQTAIDGTRYSDW
jgi:general secretion pathway protein G